MFYCALLKKKLYISEVEFNKEAFRNAMKKVVKTIVALSLIISGFAAQAQSDQELARSKGIEAVKLMDNGKFDESRKLLAEAQKLDPENLVYPYEMAFAYQLQRDYKKGIKILEGIKSKKGFSDAYYGMLGSLYDYDKQPEKALKTYDAGLKKFPRSGKIYLEKGVMLVGQTQYAQALYSFERGIEVEPTFPSNYYWATKLYLNSDNEIWGMLYGEIFMNMERNTKRTAEISKMLYNTYQQEIKLTSDTTAKVSFAKNVISFDKKSKPEDLLKSLSIPYSKMQYETSLVLSLTGEKTIDLVSLNRIRSRFVDVIFQQTEKQTQPNLIYTFMKDVKDAGQMEAYNYWLLMKGDEPAFIAWKDANPEKWESFSNWFVKFPLVITEQNKFHSAAIN